MPNEWTAQCMITTDRDGNQLATFSPGAMAHADRLPWPDDTGIVCGISPPACEARFWRTPRPLSRTASPSSSIRARRRPSFSGDELLALTRAAACVAFSDYEAPHDRGAHESLSAELSRLTGAVFCTHGSQGSSVWQKGEETVIPAPKVEAVDPVGAGDAYRGGLLWSMERGLDAVSCAIAGTVMGAAKATATGPSYRINAELLEKAVRRALPSTAGHKEKGAPSRTAERLFHCLKPVGRQSGMKPWEIGVTSISRTLARMITTMGDRSKRPNIGMILRTGRTNGSTSVPSA